MYILRNSICLGRCPFGLETRVIIKRTGSDHLALGHLGKFWVPIETKSTNFQHLLGLGFRKTSRNLNSFRKLLFSLFQRTLWKNLNSPETCQNDPLPWTKMIWSFKNGIFSILIVDENTVDVSY